MTQRTGLLLIKAILLPVLSRDVACVVGHHGTCGAPAPTLQVASLSLCRVALESHHGLGGPISRRKMLGFVLMAVAVVLAVYA